MSVVRPGSKITFVKGHGLASLASIHEHPATLTAVLVPTPLTVTLRFRLVEVRMRFTMRGTVSAKEKHGGDGRGSATCGNRLPHGGHAFQWQVNRPQHSPGPQAWIIRREGLLITKVHSLLLWA